MNAEQYISILRECLLGSMQESKVNKEDIIFSQDNNLKLATKWFKNYNITILS